MSGPAAPARASTSPAPDLGRPDVTSGGRDPVVAWLLACCLALMAARVQLAAVPALWIDESFSIHHARGTLERLWTEGWRLESSPPLYYTALWAWQRIVGDGEQAARLLSVALTAVATVFVFLTARVLAGPRAGAAAALVWLLPALAVEYAVEIRPYALQLVWISVATWALAGLLAGPASSPPRVAARTGVLVLAAAAAFYTHSTSFAFIAGLAAAALYGLVASGAGRRAYAAWAAACAALALACVPQALTMLGVLSTNRVGLGWIPSTLDPIALSHIARQLMLGQMHWGYAVSAPLAAALYGAVALSAWRMRERPAVVALGVVMPAVGALALVAANLVQPVLLHRTALWLLLPIALLVGCAAASVAWRSVALRTASVVLLFVIAASNGAYLESRAEQRPWGDVFRELATRIEPGDRIVVVDREIACVLDRYASGALRDAPRFHLDRGAEGRFRLGQRIDLGCNRPPGIAPHALADGPGADWVLTGDGLQREDLAAALRVAGERATVDEWIERRGRVHATRVVRR